MPFLMDDFLAIFRRKYTKKLAVTPKRLPITRNAKTDARGSTNSSDNQQTITSQAGHYYVLILNNNFRENKSSARAILIAFCLSIPSTFHSL